MPAGRAAALAHPGSSVLPIIAAALLLGACAPDRPDHEPEADRTAIDSPAASGSEADSTAPPSSEPGVLTADGWGPLRIGMSREQVVAAAGPDANPEQVGGPDPASCDQFRPADAPDGMLVMLVNDTLSRITLMRDSEVRTGRGFGIGDSASAILAAYGRAAVETPHKYRDAPSAYITVWTAPPDGDAPARGIVYDIGNDSRVSLIHAGDETVAWVEGCL